MTRRKKRTHCLICLDNSKNNRRPWQQLSCKHLCHKDCFQNWQRYRTDLDFHGTEFSTNRSACPLCNIPAPYQQRYCPGCGVAYVRVAGCNLMQCTICRHRFDHNQAPRHQPPQPMYSVLELWLMQQWQRLRYRKKPFLWFIYFLVYLVVASVTHYLLGRTDTDSWDRIIFSAVFGGLAAMQLFVHTENLDPHSPDRAALGYLLLLGLCGCSLLLKIGMNIVRLFPDPRIWHSIVILE